MKRKPSHPRPARPARRRPDALDLADQAMAACRRIQAIAALLTSYGASQSSSPSVEPEVIARAGSIIESDAHVLSSLLINQSDREKGDIPSRR